MKRAGIILICVAMLILFLTSCSSLRHEHIAGEYQYDDVYHWQSVRCTWNKCDIEPAIEKHFDNDGDNCCDECGEEYGIYYGAPHTPVQKEYKEPTCKEEGYSVIGCTECDEIYSEETLPTVDCYFENGVCIWCGAEENN